MIFLAERPPFTHACFPAAAAVGAGEGCWKSGSWDAGDPAVSEAGGLVSRCISLARVLAVPNVSPVRVSKIGLLSFKSLIKAEILLGKASIAEDAGKFDEVDTRIIETFWFESAAPVKP